MALITVQRNPKFKASAVDSSQMSDENTENVNQFEETDYCLAHKSLNEFYFAVRGAAVILPHEDCLHVCKTLSKNPSTIDIQKHLQSMFLLLRPEDTLKMAVKLESAHQNRNRYLIIVNVMQQREESCLLGIDCNEETTIGLVLPVWADTRITLDGDGGFSVTSSTRHHIFKPVSVQAMWSALQALHKASNKSRENNYFEGGGTHSWIKYYERRISSDRSCLNEWHIMEDLVNKRPHSPDLRTKPSEQVAIEQLIRAKLKEVMMSVDLDEVTSKFIRNKLEKELKMDLSLFKPFIDEVMLIILGQMEESSEIFEYLYLGSEFNASNYEELKGKGVGKILNVTREIDNFFPGTFDYYNIRVYDDDSTEMLKYWDKTFRYIRKAKDEGSKVLVHCKKGISRSASVVLAFIMKETGWGLDQSIDYVRNKRSCISPNSGFLNQLKIYQGILDASKQRHNSLWRSKSETNLVSKDVTLNRKNSEQISKNSPHKQSNLMNDSNKENSNIDNYLNIPGSVERPKSWSPDDMAFNQIFPTQLNSKNCGNKEIKNRRTFTGRQRFGTDPSCYYIIEAKKNIEAKHIDTSTYNAIKTNSILNSNLPKVSIVKDRITDFETIPQNQGGIGCDITKTNSSSGLVHILANQFESTNSSSSLTKKTTQLSQKEVMSDLSNMEPNQKTGLLSKPPIPKPSSMDKLNKFESESDRMPLKANNLFDSTPIRSIPSFCSNSSCKVSPIVEERLRSSSNNYFIDDYYLKDSSELNTKSDAKLVPDGTVFNTKRKIENNLKRTNSYDSILTNLSQSLFDKRNSESQPIERPLNMNKFKAHKRSTSLHSCTAKLAPLPPPMPTTRLPPIRLCSSLTDPKEVKLNANRMVHSKSMPSVIEAVNEVLTSTRDMIDSIPLSRTQINNNFNFNRIESSNFSTNFINNKLTVKEKRLTKSESQEFPFRRTQNKPKDIEKRSFIGTEIESNFVKRITKEIEAKAKGNLTVNDENPNNNNEQKLSHSTPSSPSFSRNGRQRSSTFNDYTNEEILPVVTHHRKTSLELPSKRTKCQTSYDNETQAINDTNLNNNIDVSCSSTTKVAKTSKRFSNPIQTNVNINSIMISSKLGLKGGNDCVKKQPQKKLQQGKSHPLTRLMPQSSKANNSGQILNTT